MIATIENAGFIWHRLWSMRLMLLTTAYTSAAGAWLVLPPDWKPELTHTEQMILAGIGMILPALASVSLVIKQQALADKIASKASENAK